jgi:hypothetical protein
MNDTNFHYHSNKTELNYQTVLLIRSERVLMVLYNTQNYGVFGLCPSPGILE